MGLYSFTLAGAGYILIGAWESLRPISSTYGAKSETLRTAVSNPDAGSSSSCSSPLTYAAVCLFSLLFIADSLISLFNAVDSDDGVGSALQLQILPIAALFFLYSVLGLLTQFRIRFPAKLINLIALFGFVEEFLLYYLQKKDKTGVENRYFDLLLVPISICVVSTLLELKQSGAESESSCYPRLGRGIGLILHGTWFVQMGISFYSNLIVQGCHLRAKSRGNYTIACKGHPEYHRANGIATLQFNCHLALIVILASALYSSIVKKMGGYNSGDLERRNYKPLGAAAEMVQMESGGGRFTLESDEDEMREEENGVKELGVEGVVRVGANGYGSHD